LLDERQDVDEPTGLVPGDAGRRVSSREVVIVVKRDPKLLEIVLAGHPAGGLAGGLYRREQEGDEHADDGDDDEELDEGEAAVGGVSRSSPNVEVARERS
jgi:hypothetical protein